MCFAHDGCPTDWAVFKNMKYPVRDRRVILSPAWSLSTHIRRSTDFPLVSGALGGNGFGHVAIECFSIHLHR